jgi:Tol biopolymer transport system component
VKLGIVNAIGGETRGSILTNTNQHDLLISRVTWSPDGKKVVFQAQNREQTFLDLNFADARDGKSSNVIHETNQGMGLSNR